MKQSWGTFQNRIANYVKYLVTNEKFVLNENFLYFGPVC